MKARYVISIIGLLLLGYIGCGPGNAVSIKSFEPSGEVNNLQTFVIEFSEDLAPPEKQNTWLDDEFVTFEPAIEGKFKWTSGNTLLFSPDQPLQPIQEYQAKVSDLVLFNSGFAPEFENYSFHTPYFDATEVDFFWTNVPNEYYTVSVQANIKFNYAVNPDIIEKYLEITKQGEHVSDFEIVTEDASDIIAINFGEMEQSDKEQDFVITVKSGLESVLGKKPLAEDREFASELPPITQLAITSVSSGFDGNTAWIEVTTTQMVDQKNLKKYVSVKPSRSLKYSVSDNTFRVEGNYSGLNSVELKIEKGLPGMYGGELQFDYEQVVSLVDLNPSITFAEQGGKYLMYSGERTLEVNAVNIDEVDITVSRVFKNNLLHFLNQYSYSYGYDYDYYDYYYEPGYNAGNYGKELYTETKKLKGNRNWLERFGVNLDRAIGGEYKGIYVVKVMSSEDRWRNASKMLAMSDLGIITKYAEDQMIVFINSIKTTEPVAGVEVSLISNNNQILLTEVTDGGGIVTFDSLSAEIAGFTPRLITAEQGDDFNYIDLQESGVETSRFDVGGINDYGSDYLTYIYSDRNLYRPGETINLSAILRTKLMDPVRDIPVLVKIITPTGKTYEEFKKTLNNEGSFELSFEVPDYAQTGQYVAEVYSSPEVLIGSYRFNVEDFVPDKIRVMLNNKTEETFPGNMVEVDVDAEFLFGAKASGANYEVNTSFSHIPFRSKNFGDFNFADNTHYNSGLDGDSFDGQLDDNGQANITYYVPEELSSKGLIQGAIFVNVFDPTGRTVSRATTYTIYPREYYTGIKSPGTYNGVNENLTFKVVAVDKNDEAAKNFKGVATLVRYEWQTVLKRDYSDRYYYASEKKEIEVWEKNIRVDGKAQDVTFAVDRSGSYELRFAEYGSEYYSKTEFYAYGWSSSSASSFEVDKEGQIDIVFDKEVYEPGDKAKVLFIGPFSGKLLVTVERDGIYHHEYVPFENKSAEIILPVLESYLPNVYVSATLFKEHTADMTTPFLVGHGYASMKVEKQSNKIDIQIVGPDKIKPNTTQEIVIETDAGKDVFVTFAAVDEGILQIKNFKTPDPYGYMYAKRPLNVDSYDMYELLLPEIISMSPVPGGGMFEDLEKRTNPVSSKRFELLAYWSGIRKTNSSGEIRIPLSIPQFNGEVRLMAVAYSGSRFGSVDKPMKVADDIILEPEIPRFLAIGDTLNMPVTVINTTDSDGDVDITVTVDGPLKLISDKEATTEVDANATGKVEFKIVATEKIGSGKITINADGKAEVEQITNIGVRPVSPLVVENGSGTIKAGDELDIKIPAGYLEGTQNTKLTISRFPAVKFAKQLKYLVGYPHGCVEQTTSKLFPQLYFESLAKLVAPEMYRTNNPVYFVKEGIRKLENMQLYNGALAYWSGGTYESWWGSAYAGHFLLEAKKAGFDVQDDVLNNLLKYLSGKAKEKSTTDYVTWNGNRRTVKKIAQKEIVYSLYVLALAGKGDISTMNYYKARPHLLSDDMVYMLAGAYALMDKWNAYHDMIPKKFTPEKTERQTGGTFDSEMRANAIMLNVLLEVDPKNEQIPLMIKHLSQNAKYLYSTQERSFFFLAMGKAASKSDADDIKVDVVVDGKTLKTFTGADFTIEEPALNNAKVILNASGSGEVYYFWNTEGIKVNEPVKESDSYMIVRRNYYDYRTGQQIENDNFRQGQLIVCKISLNGRGRNAENIVITDMIPAGFEIENPRLNLSADMPFQSPNPINVQHMDIRDDRLLLFTDLQGEQTKTFYYMLRVVNKGIFKLPVIGAEAMYDPEFHSYNGAGIIEVLPRKIF